MNTPISLKASEVDFHYLNNHPYSFEVKTEQLREQIHNYCKEKGYYTEVSAYETN